MTGFTWRRYMGWFPMQKCIECRRWYWAGLPKWGMRSEEQTARPRLRLICLWMPWWQEFCSRECYLEDSNRIADDGD